MLGLAFLLATFDSASDGLAPGLLSPLTAWVARPALDERHWRYPLKEGQE
jgi:hypothetical protein